MRSKLIVSAVTLMAVAVAAPAFADDKAPDQRPSFPMPAATFKQHIDAKEAKMREHAEKRFAQLPADQAKEARAKLDAKIAAMNAEVAKAVADGTVTKDEARTAWAAGGHGKGGGACDHHRGGEKK